MVKNNIEEWKRLSEEIKGLEYMVGQAKIEKTRVPSGPKWGIGIATFFVSGEIFLILLPKLMPGVGSGMQLMGVVISTMIAVMGFSSWYKKSEHFQRKAERLVELKEQLNQKKLEAESLRRRIGDTKEFIDMQREAAANLRIERERLAKIEEEEREAYIEAEYDYACRRYYSY